jgi:hypothetical protein
MPEKMLYSILEVIIPHNRMPESVSNFFKKYEIVENNNTANNTTLVIGSTEEDAVVFVRIGLSTVRRKIGQYAISKAFVTLLLWFVCVSFPMNKLLLK